MQQVEATLVSTVRHLAQAGPCPVPDSRLSEYLLWRGSTSARDRMARTLANDGVDMVSLDAMRVTVDRIRRERSETLIRLLSPDGDSRTSRQRWQAYLAGLDLSHLQRIRWSVQDEAGARLRVDATRPDGDPIAWFGAHVRWMVFPASVAADDHQLGAYLLTGTSSPVRSALIERLAASGVDERELVQMDEAVIWMRLMSDRKWRALARSRPRDFAVSIAALHNGRAAGNGAMHQVDVGEDVVDDDTFDTL